MRNLTESFILEMGPHADQHIKEEDLDDGHHSYVTVGYGYKSEDVRDYILSLPSAGDRGHSSSSD